MPADQSPLLYVTIKIRQRIFPNKLCCKSSLSSWKETLCLNLILIFNPYLNINCMKIRERNGERWVAALTFRAKVNEVFLQVHETPLKYQGKWRLSAKQRDPKTMFWPLFFSDDEIMLAPMNQIKQYQMIKLPKFKLNHCLVTCRYIYIICMWQQYADGRQH